MASFLKKTLKQKVQKWAIFGLGFYLVGLQGFHAAGQFFGNRKNWPVTVAAFGGFGFLLYNQVCMENFILFGFETIHSLLKLKLVKITVKQNDQTVLNSAPKKLVVKIIVKMKGCYFSFV